MPSGCTNIFKGSACKKHFPGKAASAVKCHCSTPKTGSSFEGLAVLDNNYEQLITRTSLHLCITCSYEYARYKKAGRPLSGCTGNREVFSLLT